MFAFANKDGGMGAGRKTHVLNERKNTIFNLIWGEKRIFWNWWKKIDPKKKSIVGKKKKQKHSRKYSLKLSCGLFIFFAFYDRNDEEEEDVLVYWQ